MFPSYRSVILVALLLVAVAVLFIKAQGPGSIPAPTASLQVFALPVGQGDCTVIQCPNGNIIVFDCGSSGGPVRMLNQGIEKWLGTSINRVVAILISHPNADHFNYLPYIGWNPMSIGAVIIGGTVQSYEMRGQAIGDWINKWSNAGKLFTIGAKHSKPPSSCIGNCDVSTGTNFCSDSNIQFNILAANNGTASTSNELSIVMKMVVGEWSMLLSGDMEGTASLKIANLLGSKLQSVVYKMSHHGASSKANMDGWLGPIKPQFAFASSGYNYGKCKHPTCETKARLLELKTITKAKPHQFYCGNPPSGSPTPDNDFPYNMLQTSPNNTHICLLTYVSTTSVLPNSNCFIPSSTFDYQVTGDDDFDEECDDGSLSGGGVLSTTTSLFVLTTAVVLFSFVL